jgi:hypothetical protein
LGGEKLKSRCSLLDVPALGFERSDARKSWSEYPLNQFPLNPCALIRSSLEQP